MGCNMIELTFLLMFRFAFNSNKSLCQFPWPCGTMPRQLIMWNTWQSWTFCCLSTSNMMKSFGSNYPVTSEELLNLSKSCNFTPFIEQKCVIDLQMRKFSRFCKTSQSSCILREIFSSPCTSYRKLFVLIITFCLMQHINTGKYR